MAEAANNKVSFRVGLILSPPTRESGPARTCIFRKLLPIPYRFYDKSQVLLSLFKAIRTLNVVLPALGAFELLKFNLIAGAILVCKAPFLFAVLAQHDPARWAVLRRFQRFVLPFFVTGS